jgi:hypothetical protein
MNQTFLIAGKQYLVTVGPDRVEQLHNVGFAIAQEMSRVVCQDVLPYFKIHAWKTTLRRDRKVITGTWLFNVYVDDIHLITPISSDVLASNQGHLIVNPI